MKKVEDLTLGFNDAENYKHRKNKELFNRVFVKSDELDQLLKEQTYFLVGDKGTGKTAYAVFLSNNEYKNHKSSLKYIRETDYRKFVSLKQKKHLELSDYQSIWKVILYLLISKQIIENEPKGFLEKIYSRKLKALNNAINEYYSNAFSPEIIYALNIMEESSLAANLIADKKASIGGESKSGISFSESRFQMNLFYIERQFEEALSALKLEKNHTLYIDGIDIRPANLQYEEYLECIKGLTNALWTINSDFFSNIKDSKGRIKAVMLIRPDIFSSVGLQNTNNKIADNSVLLDLRTTYNVYRDSLIFNIVDNLLSKQQEKKMEIGEAWDYYFPYKLKGTKGREDDSFVGFLRYGMSRPRDIISAVDIMQSEYINSNRIKLGIFTEDDFESREFKNKYSEYLLGEVKDQLSFYYAIKEYEIFLKFFEFLYGKYQFGYNAYLEAYQDYMKHLDSIKTDIPRFARTADDFLQFLYNLNVIGFIDRVDGQVWQRWCYRQRSYSNIDPKVKTHTEYIIHYGLGKALNIGRVIDKTKNSRK
ncbi:MAG: funZ protein [Lewinellaceae bacterium]|nr:funZ protein [Lewinellaceae bacterium]